MLVGAINMNYQEHKLLSMEAFTIQVKHSYGNTLSTKIYRTANAAQKAANKACAKDSQAWEVLPLNVSYTEVVQTDTSVMLDRVKKYLPQVLKHMEDESVKINSFDMTIDHAYNVLRWAPYPGKQVEYAKGDQSLEVDIHLKYSVDI